jgi:hypothetical protein
MRCSIIIVSWIGSPILTSLTPGWIPSLRNFDSGMQRVVRAMRVCLIADEFVFFSYYVGRYDITCGQKWVVESVLEYSSGLLTYDDIYIYIYLCIRIKANGFSSFSSGRNKETQEWKGQKDGLLVTMSDKLSLCPLPPLHLLMDQSNAWLPKKTNSLFVHLGIRCVFHVCSYFSNLSLIDTTYHEVRQTYVMISYGRAWNSRHTQILSNPKWVHRLNVDKESRALNCAERIADCQYNWQPAQIRFSSILF